MPKLVIFDCDGVLVQSEEITLSVLIAMLNAQVQNGKTLDSAYFIEHFRGRKIADCLREAEQLLGIYLTPQFEEDFRVRALEALTLNVKATDGILDVLNVLEIPYCVASSAPRNKIEQCLRLVGLLPYFEGRIFSCYELGRWKPDPLVFLTACETYNVEPCHALVIEDSVTGIQAAVAATIQVLGFGPVSRHRILAEAGALPFADMRELPTLIDQVTQGASVVGTLGYIERLKRNDPCSEVWWDSSPVVYAPYKKHLLDKYPAAAAHIEQLMPQDLSQPWGFSSVTTNPRLVTAAILDKKEYWSSRFNLASLSPGELRKQLYNEVIAEGASTLKPLWVQSAQADGWICAQVDPSDVRCTERMTARGLELHRLAANVMVKVPGSQEGFATIEHLVAQGVSVNITFCFTVSQFQAGIQAIERGIASARRNGVDTGRCKYVITFMIGRFSCQPEFALQAAERGLALGPEDMRWAELMIYQQIQALVAGSKVPVKTLLSSIKVDVDERGHKHCWHLEKTGLTTTCYTLTPDVVEFLIERESHGKPVAPAREPQQVPAETFARLIRIPYFCEAYFIDSIEPYDFGNHEAFINACNEANSAHRRLTDYCVRLCPVAKPFARSLNAILAAEYGVLA
ncbi:HAD superfamily hydrolase (TIGR01509 family) [Pseudomonas sp. JAI120]|nr:HAD superfamily hydrolase (TIGR01509 family) [Pseudomonas sp. SJZ073]MBB6316642.1 HAD superfamily hydrolase (TIGR01509 family) [Pseudomonas sp. JAI120]